MKLLPAPLIPFSFNLCPCVEVAEAKAKAMDINNAHTAALLAVSVAEEAAKAADSAAAKVVPPTN